MKVGDLVRWQRWIRQSSGDQAFGIIIEVPPPDDYWGATAVVEWINGFREEIEAKHFEVIQCK